MAAAHKMASAPRVTAACSAARTCRRGCRRGPRWCPRGTRGAGPPGGRRPRAAAPRGPLRRTRFPWRGCVRLASISLRRNSALRRGALWIEWWIFNRNWSGDGGSLFVWNEKFSRVSVWFLDLIVSVGVFLK